MRTAQGVNKAKQALIRGFALVAVAIALVVAASAAGNVAYANGGASEAEIFLEGQGPVATLDTQETELNVGDTFDVAISFSGEDLASGYAQLSWDDSKFTLTEITAGSALQGTGLSFMDVVSEGKFSFYGNTASLTAGGVVAVASFQCTAAVDAGSIGFVNAYGSKSGETGEIAIDATDTLELTVTEKEPIIRDGALYRIQSAANSNLVLDVAGAMPKSGANVSVWTNNSGANQVFKVEVVENGFVVLRNLANPNLVLDAAGKNPELGANVSTWTYNGDKNQQWRLAEAADGSIVIYSVANSNYALDAAGPTPKSGSNVCVWEYEGNANQRWTFVDAMDFADAQVSASGMARMECGSALEADVAVTLNGIELEAGEDFQVYYEGAGGTEYAKSTEAPSAAGTYRVSAEGAGLYHGTVEAGTMCIYAADSVKADGTRYHAKSLASSASGPDFVLDVANVDPVKGSNVSIWKDNSGANQLFTFELGDDGYYVIRNARNTELVLDAAGAEPEIGANVSTWSENGGLNQKWVVIPAAAGGCFIASAYDASFVLDAAGDEPVIGANVSIWTAKSDAAKNKNQRWEFLPAMDVSEAEVSATGMSRMECGSALEVDVEPSLNGIALVEGTDFEVLYDGESHAPSQAGTYEVSIRGIGLYCGTLSVGEMTIHEAPSAIQAGTAYRIHSAVDDTFVLDVANKQPVKGSNVSVWTSNGGDNQMFTFELGDDGYYVIRNVANTELVLDASGSEPVIGANVSTWSENGGKNQKWVIVEKGAGVYAIQSAFDPSFVLDAAGKQPSIGANVSIWTDNGGDNQHWTFEEIPQA